MGEGAMFLRRYVRERRDTRHTYWSLVRSERIRGKVRQRVVAYLGEIDEEGRAKAAALAEHFLGKKPSGATLFAPAPSTAAVKVLPHKVRVERSRAFGDVWLAWQLWKVLRLDAFCESSLDQGRESVPWPAVAALLVLARFCEPSSELHIAEQWYRQSALEDLIGIDPELIQHTRLYRGLDHLLPQKAGLERHLKERCGTLFQLEFDLLLYDVTSTYVEGEALLNPLAQRGYSRDHRPDCKQVCIGLVATRDGFPLGYEIFHGNRTDVTTVEEIVELMETRYGKAKRVWVMDRGMVSEDVLEWLHAGGRGYLVGAPRSELKKWRAALEDPQGWQQVREGLEVKYCPGPLGNEIFLLCRSADRQKKEQAIHERFHRRIVEGVERLARRLERAVRPADASQVNRQIGRLLERNQRSAKHFVIEVKADPSRASGLRLDWQEPKEWSEWARLSEGAYLLRSNVANWSAEDLWKTYVQLCQVEDAFRIHKSELTIRPIFHQLQHRVEAHILVCFLAYAMWKTLEGWMKRAGLGSSPRKLLEELKTIRSVDVVLPLEDGTELKLRCVAQPDPTQAALLDRLGLKLPTRLKPPAPLVQM
jgi:transposase